MNWLTVHARCCCPGLPYAWPNARKLQYKWWSERLETEAEAEAEQRAAKFIAWLGEQDEDTFLVHGHSCMAHKLWAMER